MSTFKLKVENIRLDAPAIEEHEFATKKEAQSKRRKIMKAYNMVRHAGHVINYSTGIEVTTNFD